jgi:hypothetical protein
MAESFPSLRRGFDSLHPLQQNQSRSTQIGTQVAFPGQIWDTAPYYAVAIGVTSWRPSPKRGDRQWRARVRRKGHTVNETFETKALAVAWARQIENDIEAGRFHPGRLEGERTILNDALERYLAERVPLTKGIKQNTGIVRVWQRSPLAGRPLAAIRGANIAAWRDEKLWEAAPQTVVHHLNLLSNLYNIAASDWGMESLVNPVSRVKKPTLPSGREWPFERQPHHG